MPDVFMVICTRERDQSVPLEKQIRGWNKGDVMLCLPTTHQFSESELSSPNYRIAKATLTDQEIATLMERNRSKDVPMPKRVKRIDVDALVAEGKLAEYVDAKNGVISQVDSIDVAAKTYVPESETAELGVID